jgi:lysophospholipase L1-like esterase
MMPIFRHPISPRTSVLVGVSLVLALGFIGVRARAGDAEDGAPAPATARRPTLFIIGDSTVKNRTTGLLGWGDPIANLFDPTTIRVENRALGGRSSRTYLTEGLWDRVLAGLKPGDFVLVQFGHNDGGPLDRGRARASLKGTGEETREIENETTGRKETVHTYGWYLRKYITDTRGKGATPIILSPIPRNIWTDDGTVARASNDYGKWAAEVAKAEGVPFIDLNERVASCYEQTGRERVASLYFGTDHTHTTPAGARLNAALVVQGIEGLEDCPLRQYLPPTSKLIEPPSPPASTPTPR